MQWKRETLFAVLGPVLLGVFIATLLSRLYTAPYVFTDTIEYIDAAQGGELAKGFRTPFYGWLLLAALSAGHPMIAVVLQIMLWLSCIALTGLLTLLLTGSAARTAAVGTLFVLGETAMMVTLPTNWFLLTDAPYAECQLIGLLCLFIGAVRKSERWMLGGSLIIGLMNIVRPITAGVVVASVAVVMLAWILRHGRPLRRAVIALALLWTPILILSASNKLTLGTFSPSSQLGKSLIIYAIAMAEPGDRVFDDEILNRAFHETLATEKAPSNHRGVDPYDMLTPGPKAVSEFYASMAGTGSPVEMRRRVNEISTDTTLRIFRLHPASYARHVLEYFVFFMLPDDTWRGYFWHPNPSDVGSPLGTYMSEAMQQRYWRAIERQTGKNLEPLPDFSAARRSVARMLDIKTVGLRLPKDAGPKTITLAVFLVLFCLGAALRMLRRSDLGHRLLGLAILILGFNSVFHAFFQALVTLPDPRYRLPGLMTSALAVLLACVSLTLAKEATAIRR